MRFRGPLGAALALAMAACGQAEGQGGGAPPAPTVEVSAVAPELLRHLVTIPGQLEASLSVELRAETEGILEEILFAEGAAVVAGAPLFRLRQDEEQARLAEARAQLALKEAVYQRTRNLVARDVASQAELERVRAERDVAAAQVQVARVELARTEIRAPFDGVMGALRVSPGDRIRRTTPLTRIDALDRLQLVFSLPEAAVALVSPGAPVEVEVAPFPGERFPGEIYFVSPTLDTQTRRVLVKAWVPNPDHRLRPGLFAQSEAEIARRPDALLVPESALVYGLEGVSVWRLDGDERVHPVPVELGLRQEGRVEIVRGLRPGDRVVVAGIHKVSAGERVEAVVPAAPPALPREVAEDPARPGASGGPGEARLGEAS